MSAFWDLLILYFFFFFPIQAEQRHDAPPRCTPGVFVLDVEPDDMNGRIDPRLRRTCPGTSPASARHPQTPIPDAPVQSFRTHPSPHTPASHRATSQRARLSGTTTAACAVGDFRIIDIDFDGGIHRSIGADDRPHHCEALSLAPALEVVERGLEVDRDGLIVVQGPFISLEHLPDAPPK